MKTDLKSSAEIASDKAKRPTTHAALRKARGDKPIGGDDREDAAGNVPPPQHAEASANHAPPGAGPLPLAEAVKLFPTLYVADGAGSKGVSVKSPRQNADLKKVLAWLHLSIGDADFLASIKALDVEYDKLQARIAAVNPRLRKVELSRAQSAYTSDPTDENFTAAQAAQFNPQKSQQDFQMAKRCIDSFTEKRVKPLLLPLLTVILPRIMEVIESMRGQEEQLCEDLGIPLQYSPALMALECCAHTLMVRSRTLEYCPSLRPSVLAAQLGVNIDEPSPVAA